MLHTIPGKGKDVVDEWGTVLLCKHTDIVGQSLFKSIPAAITVVDYVEPCVFVVQLQPLYTLWHLKCIWKQTHKKKKNYHFSLCLRLWDSIILVNTVSYLTCFWEWKPVCTQQPNYSCHLHRSQEYPTSWREGIIKIRFWNVFIISVCSKVTHLDVYVALSDVSRKCSCVRVTWSPLRLTVTSGKPFCDVHELIISDTFWGCVESSTWKQKDKSTVCAVSLFLQFPVLLYPF